MHGEECRETKIDIHVCTRLLQITLATFAIRQEGADRHITYKALELGSSRVNRIRSGLRPT